MPPGETLSDKRRRAGRRGAAARWGNGNDGTPGGNGRGTWRSARPTAKLRQGRNDWYRIENRRGDNDQDGQDVAEIWIYDEIGYFGITAADFVRDLQDVTAGQILLHLNTPGGDVFDGIAIYNALRDHAADVEVTVDALAASAGSFIAQAGERVVMTKNASMMIHDAHGLMIGNADDARTLADLLDKQSDNIASIYAERAGGTVDDWREAMRAESWYNADEAVEAGLADEVKGRSEEKNSWDLSIYSYAGRRAAPAPVIPDRAEPPSDPAGDPEPTTDVDVASIHKALEGAFA